MNRFFFSWALACGAAATTRQKRGNPDHCVRLSRVDFTVNERVQCYGAVKTSERSDFYGRFSVRTARVVRVAKKIVYNARNFNPLRLGVATAIRVVGQWIPLEWVRPPSSTMTSKVSTRSLERAARGWALCQRCDAPRQDRRDGRVFVLVFPLQHCRLAGRGRRVGCRTLGAPSVVLRQHWKIVARPLSA
jgi:hypothetical protein